MALERNDALRTRIRTRYAELKALHAPGDRAPTSVITDELQPEYPHLRWKSLYQKVIYYIKDRDETFPKDRRFSYTRAELHQLSLMSQWAREQYAKRTHRTLAAVDAAVQRYLARVNSINALPYSREQAVRALEARGYFSLSSPLDLSIVGLTREAVAKSRDVLEAKYDLSFRAPNILYHVPTRRRYAMTSAEEISIVQDPLKFLRSRAPHIKDHWEQTFSDPLDDAGLEAVNRSSDTARGLPVLPNGAEDHTVKPEDRVMGKSKQVVRMIGWLKQKTQIDPGTVLYKHLAELKELLELRGIGND